MTRTITISLRNYLFSLNIFITLAQDKEKGNRTFVPLINDSPLPSRPCFLKVHAHGKFLHRVSGEGLGTSEM